MVAQPPILQTREIHYPESDGKPMADSTLQFRWIVTLKENLEILFAQQSDVFIAGDLLWYPVEGNNKRCQAPDTMVVFGRPKGERRSYKQWEEEGIPPQVVFEVLSHSNTPKEMTRKLLFYQEHGVEEYYIYDPESNELVGAIRNPDGLAEIPEIQGWTSPRLGIRFELTPETLTIHAPNGERFLTPVELANQRNQARQQAEQEHQRAEQAQERAEQAQERAERLAEHLRKLGVDPNSL